MMDFEPHPGCYIGHSEHTIACSLCAMLRDQETPGYRLRRLRRWLRTWKP